MLKMYLKGSLLLCAAFLAMLMALLQTEARDARPREMQKWYFPRVKDTVPLLEMIKNCRCPRVYIPVCASNNQSYVNICKMNCYNRVYNRDVRLVHMGACINEFIQFDSLETYV